MTLLLCIGSTRCTGTSPVAPTRSRLKHSSGDISPIRYLRVTVDFGQPLAEPRAHLREEGKVSVMMDLIDSGGNLRGHVGRDTSHFQSCPGMFCSPGADLSASIARVDDCMLVSNEVIRKLWTVGQAAFAV